MLLLFKRKKAFVLAKKQLAPITLTNLWHFIIGKLNGNINIKSTFKYI